MIQIVVFGFLCTMTVKKKKKKDSSVLRPIEVVNTRGGSVWQYQLEGRGGEGMGRSLGSPRFATYKHTFLAAWSPCPSSWVRRIHEPYIYTFDACEARPHWSTPSLYISLHIHTHAHDTGLRIVDSPDVLPWFIDLFLSMTRWSMTQDLVSLMVLGNHMILCCDTMVLSPKVLTLLTFIYFVSQRRLMSA